jgi:hypothetical protein
MSNEIRATIGLAINKGKIDYMSRPNSFTASMTNTGGPTPGQILVSVYGTDVDLSVLDTPGFCWMQNLDTVNYVEYGVWDGEFDRFYPLGELKPGEINVIRLARNLFQEYGEGPGTGTGTQGAGTNTFRMRAYNQDCKVRVEAFED